jgi:AraC-like DNA-binding protein
MNMPQIARDLQLGYTQFRELFQEHAQTSPKQYQLKIRMERARELLRNTELPLKEIALRLGFHTAFHFSHQFRAHHQLSPSAWRKQGAAPQPARPGGKTTLA